MKYYDAYTDRFCDGYNEFTAFDEPTVVGEILAEKSITKPKSIPISAIENIKSEIQKAKEFSIDCDGKSDLGIALDIIDRYIKKEN